MLINSEIVLMPFLVSFISLLNMYIEEEIIQSEKKKCVVCQTSSLLPQPDDYFPPTKRLHVTLPTLQPCLHRSKVIEKFL